MPEYKRHLLVVEDNEADVELLRTDLSFASTNTFEIIWARKLDEAQAAIDTFPIEVVLLDLNLPDSEGLTTLDSLHAQHPELPIVILSGLNDESVAVKAVSRGAQDYLIKGQTAGDILARALIYAIERNRHLHRLEDAANSDGLTGLYNRRGFDILAEQQFRLERRNNKCLAVFYADLNQLKVINDTHGHSAGDRALIDAAAILKHAFRESDILARIGGDEFVALAIGCDAEGAAHLIGRMQKTIARHNSTSGLPFEISISFGVAISDPEDSRTLKQLMRQADQTLYEAKESRGA